MYSLRGRFSKVLLMLQIAGLVLLCFTGCKDTNKENRIITTAEPTRQKINEVSPIDDDKDVVKGDVTDNKEVNVTPSIKDEKQELFNMDSENALKLVTGLLLGIAEGGIIPTTETTVVVVKPGEKSCTIGSYNILKRVELAQVPNINLLNSNNAAWRISFTHHPKITVEVIDDIDNPHKVEKVYPQDNIE